MTEDAIEHNQVPALVLALPRPRLVPCQCPPLVVEVGHKAVSIRLPDLAANAGRPDVVGALCVSSTFTRVETGGTQLPDLTWLYTRQPRVLGMWAGDALKMSAAKPGRVLLVPVVQLEPMMS
jgi:hypothetical protein